MAGEDDRGEFMVRMLQEIRSDVESIRRTQADHSEQFRLINRPMEDMHESLYTSFGLAGHANVRIETLQKEISELRDRVKFLEEKV